MTEDQKEIFENRSINFKFENQEYEVPVNIKKSFMYIQLPDQRMLQVQGWMEVFPPIPRGFKVVESNNGQAFEVANLKNNTLKPKM